MMPAPDSLQRIRAALHPLDRIANAPCWNLGELEGLLPSTDPIPAAVLVGLVPRPEGLRVLLTRRTDALRHHAGQVSFPGGRLDAGEDAVTAALREAEEEVGLPRSEVEVWGAADPYCTVTGYRVTPVVGWVEPPVALHPDPLEVASIFEVPLDFLLDPANHLRHFRMLGELRRDYWAMPYKERYIWGATAAMLLILERTLKADG